MLCLQNPADKEKQERVVRLLDTVSLLCLHGAFPVNQIDGHSQSKSQVSQTPNGPTASRRRAWPRITTRSEKVFTSKSLSLISFVS